MAETKAMCFPHSIIGSVKRISSQAGSSGRRALLLSDILFLEQAEELQAMLDGSGISTILFVREGLAPDSLTFDEVISIARGSRSEIIISLGGEKVMFLGRLTAFAVKNSCSSTDFLKNDCNTIQNNSSSLPLIEIPSSGRHPFLFTDISFIYDFQGNRMVKINGCINPLKTTVVFDPSLFARRSMLLTALSLASIFSTAVEAYLSPFSGVFSNVQAERVIKTASGMLRKCRENYSDPDFLQQEAEIALLSSSSLSLTGAGPALLLSYAAASVTGIPKSMVYPVIFQRMLDSPLYSSSHKTAELIPLINHDNKSLNADFSGQISLLFGIAGLPGRLKDSGSIFGDEIFSAASIASEMSSMDEPLLREIIEKSV